MVYLNRRRMLRSGTAACGLFKSSWRKFGRLRPGNCVETIPLTSPPTIQVGKPTPLFDVGRVGSMSSYDVTRDGKRFLVNRKVGEGNPGYVLVIVIWEALLKHPAVKP